jgi:hypothetical protein
LDLLGDPARLVFTRAVLGEIHDKQDAATARVDALAHRVAPPVDPAPSPTHQPAAAAKTTKARQVA